MPYCCGELTVLKKEPRADEARRLLERLADQVLPIMHRHKWRVAKLAEFFPRNDGLLGMNVNRGAKILIRLRPPSDRGSFYPWEHLLGTLLHELVHMEIGPHSAAFYKALDALWKEAEALMDKG